VTVSATANDFSASLAQVTKGSDCVFAVLQPPQMLSLLSAIRQAGSTQQFFFQDGTLTDQDVQKFAKETNGWITSSYFPTFDQPVWDTYRTAMSQGKSMGQNLSHGSALKTWVAFEVLKDVGSTIKGNIDNASLVTALNAASDVKADGIPPVDFTKENPNPAIKRLFNTKVTVYVLKDGKRTMETPDFVDALPAFTAGTK
jgi:ABC-type branched-subunit amino acid transport system substrate-binding protein